MRTTALLLTGLALACFTLTGCEKTTDDGTTAAKSAADHGHDHEADDHEDHAHGPNGGHPFKFAEGDYQGEWKHYNDNHVIRVYILDAEGKKNTPVKADSVTISRLTGDADEPSFMLDPEEPNEDGEAVVYSLDSQDLAIAMNLNVKIEMKVGDKTYTAEIAEHEPHDH